MQLYSQPYVFMSGQSNCAIFTALRLHVWPVWLYNIHSLTSSCVASLTVQYSQPYVVMCGQSDCTIFTALRLHVWPVWLYNIFSHYLINDAIFGEKILNIKYLFRFSLQRLSETFIILWIILWKGMKNAHRVLCKVPVILVRMQRNFNFVDRFSKNSQILNSIKIPPVEARLFMWTDERKDKGTDGRTDMTKLIFAFRNFANLPKKIRFYI